MPTTINGIGTRYVGKQNLSTHQDVCDRHLTELVKAFSGDGFPHRLLASFRGEP